MLPKYFYAQISSGFVLMERDNRVKNSNFEVPVRMVRAPLDKLEYNACRQLRVSTNADQAVIYELWILALAPLCVYI